MMKRQMILKYQRNEYGKRIRKAYEAHEVKEKRGRMKEIVPRSDGLCNTITTVSKDNLVLEVIEDERQMLEGIKIKQATKEGSVFLKVGGVADFSFPKSKTRRGRVQGNGEISPTIMANKQDIWRLEEDEMKKYRLRNLTPRENWRLMGFSDEDFEKAKQVSSNTQLNTQAGNSIVVNVLEAIFREMIPNARTNKQEEKENGKTSENG